MLIVSEKIALKLKTTHNVSIAEVYECLANLEGNPLEDTSEGNETDPLSIWFIAETDYGRVLKIVIYPHLNGDYYLKTAFEAKQRHIELFNELNGLVD